MFYYIGNHNLMHHTMFYRYNYIIINGHTDNESDCTLVFTYISFRFQVKQNINLNNFLWNFNIILKRIEIFFTVSWM